MNISFEQLDRLSVAELAELLEYHNRKYWQDNAPEISDADFDRIALALRRRQPDHPLLERVFAPSVDGRGKVRHKTPMLSLDKAYSFDEVSAWAEKYARTCDELLLVEPKYDGISAGFDGKILFTRGDGEYGEDITDKLPLIELESLDYVGPLDRPVRGELLIRSDDFATIYRHVRKKDGQLYKNSRNAVAGIMGLKDISAMLAQQAKITLVDYRLHSFPVRLSELRSRWDELKRILAELPYPQDGIVIKLADVSYRNQLGNTAHHPRGELAYKFTNISRETRLTGVEWSFGKNCLTPVALLEPVEISGTTIKRASLHNLQNLLEMQVMIGDIVTVERAGDVIPYISASRPGSGERKSPLIETCPCCGEKLFHVGPELVCRNPNCRETELQRLVAAVRNLGIEHLGEPTLRRLMECCSVRHVVDLFSLTAADLLKIDGFAAKSAANLIAEIGKARHVNDYQLLASLNIPHVGINIARHLLAEHSLAELRQMTEAELSELPGIGPERAKFLKTAFVEQQDYLEELLAAITLINSSGNGGNADLKTVCFTGKMPEKRSYYEQLAINANYRPVDSVSRDLDLLVAADPSGTGDKLAKAAKYQIKVISLADFLELVADAEKPAPPETPADGKAPARYVTDDLF